MYGCADRTQEVIRDASPTDYDNAQLYQEMEKIYFVVSNKQTTKISLTA